MLPAQHQFANYSTTTLTHQEKMGMGTGPDWQVPKVPCEQQHASTIPLPYSSSTPSLPSQSPSPPSLPSMQQQIAAACGGLGAGAYASMFPTFNPHMMGDTNNNNSRSISKKNTLNNNMQQTSHSLSPMLLQQYILQQAEQQHQKQQLQQQQQFPTPGVVPNQFQNGNNQHFQRAQENLYILSQYLAQATPAVSPYAPTTTGFNAYTPPLSSISPPIHPTQFLPASTACAVNTSSHVYRFSDPSCALSPPHTAYLWKTRTTNKRRCKKIGCTTYAKTGGLCIRHGGGKRCVVGDCKRLARFAGSLCYTHGNRTKKAQVKLALKREMERRQEQKRERNQSVQEYLRVNEAVQDICSELPLPTAISNSLSEHVNGISPTSVVSPFSPSSSNVFTSTTSTFPAQVSENDAKLAKDTLSLPLVA